jgi:hypothetical protein
MTRKLTRGVLYDEQLILIGWKAIAEAWGGISIYQIKSRAKRYKMPYIRLSGKVAIPRVLLLEWAIGLCKIVNEKEEEGVDDYVVGRLRNLKRIR